MKKVLSLNFRIDRPKGVQGKGDKYLSKIIQNLGSLIRKSQKDINYDTFRIPGNRISSLAQTLVEFAEDVLNDIGIWKSLEEYNFEFFGTRLPLILEPGESPDPNPINKQRVQYLLYAQYSLLKPHLIFSPQHKDLCWLAKIISSFLNQNFEKIPRDSSIKTFLAKSNNFGWDIKKKLVWVGKHSYLFRKSFQDYVKNNGGKQEIAIVDDFVCQETTIWSGLGVVDIVAKVIDVSEEEEADIRSWYERHAAFYKVLSIDGDMLHLLNVINDQNYPVRVGDFNKHFDTQDLIYGSLVPFKGEWYWSGVQHRYGKVSEEDISKQKNELLSSTRNIVYRYRKDLVEKAKKSTLEQYEKFKEVAKGPYIIYPDGSSMADGMREQFKAIYEKRIKQANMPPESQNKYSIPDPSKSFPKELLESDNGICLYFNPEEGYEIVQEFNDILSGFKKKGVDLDDDEKYALNGIIFSDSISPGFIKTLVQQYGYESLAKAFFIPDQVGDYFLESLLRKWKGHFFRNRYPSISFVDIEY